MKIDRENNLRIQEKKKEKEERKKSSMIIADRCTRKHFRLFGNKVTCVDEMHS